MPQDLHQVAALAAEHIQIAGMRIALQGLLHLQRQPVHATAHVRRTGGQPHPHTGRRRYHPRSAVTTRRKAVRLTSCPNLMVVPSGNLISIVPWTTAGSEPAACDGPAQFAGSAPGGSPSNRTGTNTDRASGLSVPRRTWLRQFHSRPRLISYRRATSAMPAPGCSVSATIRTFSPELQRRRRSTPVMISIPPTVPDLSGAHTSVL